MATRNFMKKKNAKAYVKKQRKRGLMASVYKKAKGYGTSSTRK